MTADSAQVDRDIPSGLLKFATAGLALFLLSWLLWRPPFSLPSVGVPTGLTVTVEAGSTGPQEGESGTLWWISSPPASIGVANNSPDAVVVYLALRVTNGPCPVARSIKFGGRTTPLSPGGAASLSTGPVTLDGYERRSFDLEVSGEPCPPSSVEPRPLYVALSDLDIAQVED